MAACRNATGYREPENGSSSESCPTTSRCNIIASGGEPYFYWHAALSTSAIAVHCFQHPDIIGA